MTAKEAGPAVITEISYRRYGVFYVNLAGKTAVGLSATAWGDCLDMIQGLSDDTEIAVTPELMTAAGIPLNGIAAHRDLLEARLSEVKNYSRRRLRDTVFIIGTVDFTNGPPANCAAVIKNGEQIMTVYKRSALAGELAAGFFIATSNPAALIPGTKTGVMICSDLPNSYLPILHGKKSLFVHNEATASILLACWSVGGVADDISACGPDEYYGGFLRAYAKTYFGYFPQVRELLVVDRLPSGKTPTLIPDSPFNYYFLRQQTI